MRHALPSSSLAAMVGCAVGSWRSGASAVTLTTPGYTDIPLGVEIANSDSSIFGFTATNPEITINRTGWYLVEYAVNLERTNTTVAEGQAIIDVDPATGVYATITGTQKESSTSTNSHAGAVSAPVALQVTTPGFKVKVKARISTGTGTMQVEGAGGLLLTIIRLPI